MDRRRIKMNGLIKILKTEHCDVEEALDRCMDMEDLYLELLQMFADDTEIDKLHEAYEDHNVKEVFFHSHTLKGVYTNLGLTPLYELDIPIVETTRKGNLEGLDASMMNLEKEHRHFVSLIKELLS